MPKFGSRIDASKIPILGLVPESAAAGSPPTAPVEGQFWHDTTAKVIKVYLNGAWQALGTAGAGGPPSGSAGGDLLGSSYPNPVIANGVVTSAKIADLTIVDTDVAAANKDGADATASMRTLGYTVGKAMPGIARLHQIGVPTADVDWNGQRIINLGTPTAPADAATKAYADSIAQGLDAKQSVRMASTGNVTLSGVQTVDGSISATNDRVLLKDQSTPANNGIYLANNGGAWTRATDMDAWTEVPGAYVFVEQGTVNADTGWVCTADAGGTLGTTPIPFTQFSGAGQIIDGDALLKTGNRLDVLVDTAITGGLEIASDQLRIKTSGVRTDMIAGAAVDLVSKVQGVLQISTGGTGVQNMYDFRKNNGFVKSVDATTPTLTAGVWANITHNLQSIDIRATFLDWTTHEEVILDWKTNGVTQISVRADVDYPAVAFKVVMQGC